MLTRFVKIAAARSGLRSACALVLCSLVPYAQLRAQNVSGVWEADLPWAHPERMRVLLIRDTIAHFSDGLSHVAGVLRRTSVGGNESFQVIADRDSAGQIRLSADRRSLLLTFGSRTRSASSSERAIRWRRTGELNPEGWPADSLVISRLRERNAWLTISESIKTLERLLDRGADGRVGCAADGRVDEDAVLRLQVIDRQLQSLATIPGGRTLTALHDSTLAFAGRAARSLGAGAAACTSDDMQDSARINRTSIRRLRKQAEASRVEINAYFKRPGS